MMKIPKKCEYVRFKNYERKMKSPPNNYEDFIRKCGKQNQCESYTNNGQKYGACSFTY